MELCGLRRQAELNGQHGEVLGPIDEEGFVEVKLPQAIRLNSAST